MSGSELCHFLGDDSGSGVVDSLYRIATNTFIGKAVRKAYDGLRAVEQESWPGLHEVKLFRCTASKVRTCACTKTAARRAEAALTSRFSRWMISTTIPADGSGAREGPSGNQQDGSTRNGRADVDQNEVLGRLTDSQAVLQTFDVGLKICRRVGRGSETET